MAIDSGVGSQSKRAHILRTVFVCILVLAAGVLVGWAGTKVLTPTTDVLDATQYTYVDVSTGEVGSSVRLNTAVVWTPVPVGTNLAQGVVTSVDVQPGDEVAQGKTLYTVNLRPVTIAEGETPSFRSMGLGASGKDVEQLQQLLGDVGLLKGGKDGEYGPATEKAVNAWHKSRGMPETGIVEAGDLIFVPSLPTRISLDTAQVARGLNLIGGEQIVNGLPASPAFQIPITETQVSMFPVGTRAEIAAPDGASIWVGIVADQTVNADDGTIELVLNGENGGSICGDSCGAVPVSGRSLLSTNVVTVETAAGLVVPSAALRSEADGRVSVTDDNGTVHEVTVAATAKGMSVIEGVREGTKVRIPADDDGSK